MDSIRPTDGLVAVLGLALAIAAVSCGKDDAGIGPCRVDYIMIGGEPSDRVDSIEWDRARNVLVRTIYNDGNGSPDAAIYYYVGPDGRTLVEAYDEQANGDIEARLDAGDRIADLITPYTVDVNLQDGATDGIQLSVELPTTMIGPFNPARVYFQVPCDQGEAVSDGLIDQRSHIELYVDGREDPSTIMDVLFDERGAPQGWSIAGPDGVPDDYVTINYNGDGNVREVYWTLAGQFLGDIYLQSQFDYDVDGNLFRYRSDDNGDGAFDNEIAYSEGCFGSGFQGGGSAPVDASAPLDVDGGS